MNKNSFVLDKIMMMVGIAVCLLFVGTVWASFSTAPVAAAAGFTPTPVPVPPPGGGNDDDDDDDGGLPCPPGEIVGIVSDSCLGQPIGAVQVVVNGEIVTTDGNGHYSRSGLSPGTYDISLQIAGEWLPDSTTLTLSQCNETGTANLNYNSCPVPPTPTSDAAAFLLPETGQDSAVSPAVPLVIPISLLIGMILVGGVFYYKVRQ